MPYFALIYDDLVEDYVTRRAQFREAHLGRAKAAQARGELLLGGALADPVDTALLVFQADDQSVVEEFARDDPYVVNGLVGRWAVRPWTVVIGSLYNAEAEKGGAR